MEEIRTVVRTMLVALSGIAVYVIIQQVGWIPPLNVSPTIYLDSVEMKRK